MSISVCVERDLPRLMEFLHQHGVRGHCAFNTLIFTGELADAEKQIRLLDAAGVDAVIVQDIGLARMVKEIAPRMKLHASTQMPVESRTSGNEMALVACLRIQSRRAMKRRFGE